MSGYHVHSYEIVATRELERETSNNAAHGRHLSKVVGVRLESIVEVVANRGKPLG